MLMKIKQKMALWNTCFKWFHDTWCIIYTVFETGVVKDTGMGAWGIDELRWTFPVYPNDELKSEVKVIEKNYLLKILTKGLLELFILLPIKMTKL